MSEKTATIREWASFDTNPPTDEWHRCLRYPAHVRGAKSRHKGNKGNRRREYKDLWYRTVHVRYDE